MQFTMKRGSNNTPIVMKSTPVDTPTVVRSIVEMLEDPSEHTYDKIKAPPPAYNQTISSLHQGGGTVIINPSVEFVTTTDYQINTNTDGNIPIVVREAIAAAEIQNSDQIPVSVVQASRKRTMMTRSLSRQTSQVEIKEEPEDQEDTSDEEYIPEPVAKKSRVGFSQSQAVPQRVRNAPGRKAKARGDGLDHMEPDERQRVLQRRRKNKEAAARCRQKRVDLTNTLAGQVEREQEAKRKLEAEVQKLRLEAAKLRRQLDAHRAAGCVLQGTAGPAAVSSTAPTLSYQLPAGAVAIKSQAPVAAPQSAVIVQAAHGGHFVLSEGQQPQHIASRPQRPQTLGLVQKQHQPMSKDKVQIRMEEMDGGYKVETPSRIIGGLAADLFTPTGLFGGLNTPCNETLTSLTAL